MPSPEPSPAGSVSPSSSPRGLAIAKAAARVIPGGVNSSTRYIGEPYAFVEADGAYVTDADGRRYLDYHAAFGAILLGHNAAVVNDAVSRPSASRISWASA